MSDQIRWPASTFIIRPNPMIYIYFHYQTKSIDLHLLSLLYQIQWSAFTCILIPNLIYFHYQTKSDDLHSLSLLDIRWSTCTFMIRRDPMIYIYFHCQTSDFRWSTFVFINRAVNYDDLHMISDRTNRCALLSLLDKHIQRICIWFHYQTDKFRWSIHVLIIRPVDSDDLYRLKSSECLYQVRNMTVVIHSCDVFELSILTFD